MDTYLLCELFLPRWGGGGGYIDRLRKGVGVHNFKFLEKRLWTGSVPLIFNFKHRYPFVFVATPS